MKRLPFTFVAALAISASAAQAGDNDRGRGNSYAYGNGKSELHASSGNPGHALEKQLSHDVKKAKKAYEEAWKQPHKPTLLNALREYRSAAHEAIEQLGDDAPDGFTKVKADKLFTYEAQRIKAHFEIADQLQNLWQGYHRYFQTISSYLPENDSKEVKLLLKTRYMEALELLEVIGKIENVSSAKAKLNNAYKEAEKRIDALSKDSMHDLVKKRHTEGAIKVKGSSEVDRHGTCKIVTDASGRQLFVSTHTKEEWASHDRSFLKNVPEGVTVRNCPPPPDDDDDDDRHVFDQNGNKVHDKDDRNYRSRAGMADRNRDGRVTRNDDGSYSDR